MQLSARLSSAAFVTQFSLRDVAQQVRQCQLNNFGGKLSETQT